MASGLYERIYSVVVMSQFRFILFVFMKVVLIKNSHQNLSNIYVSSMILQHAQIIYTVSMVNTLYTWQVIKNLDLDSTLNLDLILDLRFRLNIKI